MKRLRMHLFQRILTALALTVILLMANFGHAGACRCGPPGPPEKEFGIAPAVFLGKVVNVTKLAQSIEARIDVDVQITFDVYTVWKGSIQPTLTVYTNSGIGSCGVELMMDTEYLIYAHQNDPVLLVSACTPVGMSRSNVFTRASEDLAYLGPGHQIMPAFFEPTLAITFGGVGLLLITWIVVRQRSVRPLL